MPTTIENIEYLTLQEASAIVPGNPCPQTIGRWCTQGLRAGGKVVKCQHALAGSRIHTTREWLDQFAAQLLAARESNPQPKEPRRLLPHADAMAALKEMGA